MQKENPESVTMLELPDKKIVADAEQLVWTVHGKNVAIVLE